MDGEPTPDPAPAEWTRPKPATQARSWTRPCAPPIPHCPPDPLLHGHSIRCEENTPFDLRRSRTCELRPFSRDRLHTGVWWGGGGAHLSTCEGPKRSKRHRDYHRCVTAYATACLKAALLRLFGANWAAETLRLARRPCDFRRVCT